MLSQYEGAWKVTAATLPDGQFAYSGAITIERLQELFLLDWHISAGRYVGIGLAVNDHLLVSCGEQFAGLGVALYRRHGNGSVTATWATVELGGMVGSGRFATSIAHSFVGEHELVYMLPDGKVYGEWTLSIEERAGVYALAWRKATIVHWRGLGLATVDGLAVGWYPDINQLACLDYTIDLADDRLMQARWILGGYEGFGTETIERQA